MPDGILRLGAFTVLLTVSVGVACAEDASLDTVVVTATRTPTPVDDVLSSITVLDEATIRARQASSIQELLEGEAGIEIANNGGLGKTTSLYLRGTEADHVLVLVDGIPLSSATLGSTAFQYLPVSEIDRIEIVRGPQASLYGSDALGGVIQIFTRRGAGTFAPDLDLSTGSHGYQDVAGGAGGSTGALSYSASGSYQTTNGYDSCLGAPYVSPASPGGGCLTDVPYDDRYHNAAASARLAYQGSDHAETDLFFLRATGSTDFHSDYQNREYFVQQVAGISEIWSPLDALRLTARAGQSRDDETDVAVGLAVNPASPVPPSIFDTVRAFGTLQADWKIASSNTLSFGADYLRDQVDNNADFPVNSRRDTGEFAEYDGTFGPQHLLLSVRRDQNQQFGDKTTGGAAWGYRWDDGLRISASYATAFKAPTFDELYYPYYGTPTLEPETSRSIEIGVDQFASWGFWSLHGYDTRISNLIETDPNSFTAQNISSSVIDGLEAQFGREWQDWRAQLTGTWIDPRNESRGYDGDLLPRRAQAQARLELVHHWHDVDLTGRFNIVGKRFDDEANTIRLGGYGTLDLLVAWRLSSTLAIQGKLANLTDHSYETAYYYPADGRNFLITVMFTPLGRSN